MKIVAFNVSNWSFRGTEVSTYDYAYYNETLLNNKSLIVYPKTRDTSYDNISVFRKFTKNFECWGYDSYDELEEYLTSKNCGYLYFIKYGTLSEYPKFKGIKILIHCVYTTEQPHGDVYCAVSDCVAKKSSHSNIPVVPHIISLPDISTDLRTGLNIPQSAIVFGRHGGNDTFDIPFVKDVIINILNTRPDIWFIFAVKPKMLENLSHSRLIFLKSFVDTDIKVKFINTCDAMIHASSLGESFGISILEFCYRNKPVITFAGKIPNVAFYNNQHLINLGNEALLYYDSSSLHDRLTMFKKSNTRDTKQCCQPFTAEKVMQQFNNVFLI